jgi:hypothetical protein
MPRIQNRAVRMSTSIDIARAQAAAGAADDGVALLERTLEEAGARGFVETALQTRLALGELEVGLGRTAGRARLAAVAKEASGRGLTLIARKAAAAR